MSLGRKIVTLFFVLGASFSIGSIVVLNLTVIPAFEEFEAESMNATLRRVRQTLNADLKALRAINLDYSTRDHTIAFAAGRYPGFPEEHIYPDKWSRIDVQAMLVFDAAGALLFGELQDPETAEKLPLEAEFERPLAIGHPLVTHRSARDSVSGLVRIRSGILQVVSLPIVDDMDGQRVVGSFVVAKFLTAQRLAAIGEYTAANVSIHPADHAHKAMTLVADPPATLSTGWFANKETSSYGYSPLIDIYGEPVAGLDVRSPGRITQIGAGATRTVTMIMIVLIAVFLLAASLFMRRLIVTPLKTLTDRILNIRRTGDLHFETGRLRSDEVGVLAGEFSALTTELRKEQKNVERARDEALAISKAKSEFLARMSHEIRTPMNGILGMTELLRDTRLLPRQRRFADTIYDSAESLLNIINDILDFSKIEAGKMRLDHIDVHLRTVVEETVQGLAGHAHRQNVELMTMIPPGLNTLVKTDPVRLRQVLTNLVSNAIKFTRDGDVVVKLSLSDHKAGYQNVRFEVRDTGIGIDKKQQSEIFESFTQADGSTTRLYGGTGLGLTICKQLINQMGGSLNVESAPGEGSVFWFELSLQTSHAIASQACVQMQCVAGRRVLIVDDNATNREILEHQLGSWRAHTDCAASAEEAYDSLVAALDSGAPYDLAILDMNMPVADGLELARTIRANEDLESLKLVMLSSVTTPAEESVLNELGIAGQLSKPVRQGQLYDALAMVMGDQTGIRQVIATNTISARQLTGRVLVVEDNPVNRMVAQSMLETMGLQVTIAENGLEAVETFSNETFDLVLMDCQLPVMDGFRATELIRTQESESKRDRTPIIAATANVLKADRERCLVAGMDDFLAKPFTSEQLHAVLALYLPMPDTQHETDIDTANPATGDEETQSRARIASVIDKGTLNRLSHLQQPGAPNIVRRLLGLYLQSSTLIKDRLGKAIDASNAAVVRESAHALKSSSQNVGAVELANLCKQLELMGRDDEITNAVTLRESLEAEYSRVVDALKLEIQVRDV